MSFLNPSSGTRRVVTFYAQVLQAAAIVLGGGWALWSYEQQLQAPYDEKQLNLYLDAARVAADMAKLPAGHEKQKTEQRFWELYWGELAFVESPVIEDRMVKLCNAVFKDEKQCSHPKGDVSLDSCAIRLSHLASEEIQERWKPWHSLISKPRNWLVNLFAKQAPAPEPCPELPQQGASTPAPTPP